MSFTFAEAIVAQVALVWSLHRRLADIKLEISILTSQYAEI